VTETILASQIDNYRWTKVNLTTKPSLAAATTYWLLLHNNDALTGGPGYDNGNFCELCVYGAYPRGTISRSGSRNSGWDQWAGAGACFAVNGARETTDQISAMVTALANGMLQGTVIKTASGIYTPPYRAGDVRGLREMEQLLDAGTSNESRLLATVRRDRYVVVYAEPTASATNDVYVRTDGRLVSWRGQPLDKASLTPGQWLRLVLDDRAESELGLLGNISPCFIDETEYTAGSDSLSLRTREKTSIWDIGKVVML
jgi:hypothetical protein